MIRVTRVASENKLLPKRLTTYSSDIYCTYAWIETDEIDSEDFAIAIIKYKPKRYRGNYVFSEPVWTFIEEERTEEQQRFIESNLDRISEIVIKYLVDHRYI